MSVVRKQYPFRFSKDDIHCLDELAKHYGNRSEALRCSIRIALTELRQKQNELSTKKEGEVTINF